VAYRLVSVGPGPDALGSRPDPPLVDREAELEVLRSAFDLAVGERSCMLVTILPTGVGKSRLVREFAPTTEPDTLVLRARCLPYGDGITFWPVADLVKQVSGVVEDDGRGDPARRSMRR
jgi:predicted ATPase